MNPKISKKPLCKKAIPLTSIHNEQGYLEHNQIGIDSLPMAKLPVLGLLQFIGIRRYFFAHPGSFSHFPKNFSKIPLEIIKCYNILTLLKAIYQSNTKTPVISDFTNTLTLTTFGHGHEFSFLLIFRAAP